MISPFHRSLLRSAGRLLFALQSILPGTTYSQADRTGFAFEAYAEPWAGILPSAPYRGWLGGVGVGYRITPEYSLWLSALAGAGRRPQVDNPAARDDFGLLRISVRRAFVLDSTVSLAPVLSYRMSTFLLPDGATISGSGFEVGVGVSFPLGEHFEVGAEVAYTYDAYRHRSGPAPFPSSFSGSDLSPRLLVRFHPEIP